MLVLLALTGCDLLASGQDQIDDLQDTLDGLTNPLVVQGIVLGVAEPESSEIDLSKTDFSKGTVVTVFTADAASVNEIENAPVTGASISIKVGQQGAVDLEEVGGGAYKAAGEEVSYNASALAELSVGIGDSAAGAQVILPPAANASVPEQHDGSPMLIDLSSQEYDQVLVVVFDVGSGQVTFSNEPRDVMELYEFSTADDAGAGLTIPASAFPDESIYAVGVAGLVKGDSVNFSSMNTALSSLQAGKLKFYPVSPLALP